MIWALWGFLALVATSCGTVADNFSDAGDSLTSGDAAAEVVSEQADGSDFETEESELSLIHI